MEKAKEILYDIELFESILRVSQKELKNILVNLLLPKFYNEPDIVSQDGFIYVKGSDEVMMVAHMDTVHSQPIDILIYDEKKQILTSPEGVGGDDRCGVMGIIALLNEGYRPYILFTEDEEIGGVGAGKAERAITPPDDIKYLIEIDRRGHNDAVFYSCITKSFQKYVEDFGFEKGRGSYSDIETLMEPWDICGVNLSAGYYNEHRKNEFICIDDLYDTVRKVGEMLNNIPDSRFPYETYSYKKKYKTFDWDEYYRERGYGNYANKSNKTNDVKDLSTEMRCDCCGESVKISKLEERYSSFFCEGCLPLLETGA